MPSLSTLNAPRIQPLRSLLGELLHGRIRVARFQRPFVWTDQQRLDLLDSIYKAFPIGSIYLWHTQKHTLATYTLLGGLRTLPPDDAHHARQYVLDGHQRLTTLYAAFAPGLLSREDLPPDALDPEEPDAPDAVSLAPIAFDLLTRTFTLIHPKRTPSPPTLLPVSALLNTFDLLHALRKLDDHPDSRTLHRRAEYAARAFQEYAVPVVTMTSEDLDQVTASFQRINSGGSTMTDLDMVTALTWSTDFDLRDAFEDIRAQLAPPPSPPQPPPLRAPPSLSLWPDIDDTTLLRVLKGKLNLDFYDAMDDVAQTLRERPDACSLVRDALVSACAFLRQAHIFGPRTLPYAFQLILLALTLPDTSLTPDDAFARAHRWFWTTSLSEHFAALSAQRLRDIHHHLHALLSTPDADPTPPHTRRAISPLRRFNPRTARSRAWVTLMTRPALGWPPDLIGGALHTVEPPPAYAILPSLHGNDAFFRLCSKRAVAQPLVSAPENRFLLHPTDHEAFRHQLLTAPDTLPEDTRKLHFITDEAVQALKDNAPTAFLRLRRAELEAMERRVVQWLGLEYVTEDDA